MHSSSSGSSISSSGSSVEESSTPLLSWDGAAGARVLAYVCERVCVCVRARIATEHGV